MVSANPSPSFGFASNDSGASLSCQLDGGGFQGCSSPFTASGLADGPHTFRVRATDRAQNTGVASRTWTVDTTDSDGDDLLRSRRRLHLARSKPLVRLRLERARAPASAAGSTAAAFGACSSPFTASGLADGSHTFQVRATDAVRKHRVASRTWTVDGPADVSITAGPASGSVTKDPTPSFSFSSLDSDSDFRCRIDDASFASCASPLTTSRLSDGSTRFWVKATDAAQTTDVAWRGSPWTPPPRR